MTSIALTAAVVAFSWSSPAAAQMASCGAIAETAPISEMGSFSNIRATEDHAYGFSLRLWRAGECLFGLLTSTMGLQADMPIGTLQDITFDAKSGRLSFSAKLTMGVTSVKGSKDWVPTRDLYVFEGRLNGSTVTGVMTHTVQNHPNVSPERSDVVLPASKSDASMPGAKTYGEWLSQYQLVLKLRGPKWGVDPTVTQRRTRVAPRVSCRPRSVAASRVDATDDPVAAHLFEPERPSSALDAQSSAASSGKVGCPPAAVGDGGRRT